MTAGKKSETHEALIMFIEYIDRIRHYVDINGQKKSMTDQQVYDLVKDESIRVTLSMSGSSEYVTYGDGNWKGDRTWFADVYIHQDFGKVYYFTPHVVGIGEYGARYSNSRCLEFTNHMDNHLIVCKSSKKLLLVARENGWFDILEYASGSMMAIINHTPRKVDLEILFGMV